MIEPLQGSLVSAILECINQDRNNNGHLINAEVVRGVIESFVAVNKFKKRNNIEVICFFLIVISLENFVQSTSFFVFFLFSCTELY